MVALLRVPSSLEDFAVPAVCVLIFFLSYTSQFLFYHIEPGPLEYGDAVWFNVLVGCIWWCYDRACTVDPAPKGWVRRLVKIEKEEDGDDVDGNEDGEEVKIPKGMRWCKKCKSVKPPRAHHCKKCGRCIPKMDHHCPWTSNCVSHTNLPHFLRFVLYASIAMSILEYQLYIRASFIWSQRSLPAYLGPPVWALAHLMLLLIFNTLVLIGLLLLFVHAAHSLATNTTMIENWEIERHDALVERARKNGGWLYASGGTKMRIVHQEFPYDIGVWKNLVQGMGTWNILMWIMPFGGAPRIEDAISYEENGFEDEGKSWPPPDPEKVPSARTKPIPIPGPSMENFSFATIEEEKAAFKQRQEEDYSRRRNFYKQEVDGPRVVELPEEEEEEGDGDSGYDEEYEEGMDGEEGWTNAEGERLRDFGVDEEAEDEDDIPLGELLRRRKARAYEA
ncbi:DHHC palmitoyltransferase-domain-containing protein [Amylocarpus encephaloides]|uniref:Palmitoyltransferase PFA4 n=1 Tax=Amylocarpus encephaloides TaxID=45428 RepID=A0A9P7YGC9_9HELO|nr:DHHC palmitoyltransferase-domain-containing protein [Amylocarpus encephaloides]